ncbi:MAG: ComF family protein [Patescibacteria group bacterium]|nr:ComF family protein [Patescibacteria group bacterium]MCL5432016.1 ComF family protein [Patescibacteria group bacterium]
MLSFLLDIIYPRKCVSCGKWGKFICESCRSKIDYFSLPVCPYCENFSPAGLTHPVCRPRFGLDGMFVLGHHRGPLRQALLAMKYKGNHWLAQELAQLVLKNYPDKFAFDYLVPVPLSRARQRQRGFNQAEKLAWELKFKPVANILKRVRDTKPQFDLKFNERKKNVKDAFALSSHQPLVTSHSLCLVDDVATTGATLFECAKVLKRAGAKSVFAICVARGG